MNNKIKELELKLKKLQEDLEEALSEFAMWEAEKDKIQGKIHLIENELNELRE